MDVFEAIEKRHSYRGSFRKKPVPREDLVRIVQAGIQAPSGYNAQSTSFVIVDDTTLIRRIAEITESDVIRGAPALIVCVKDPLATIDKKFQFPTEDFSAATENMLLAIVALGYASVWIDGLLREERRVERIGEVLSVPRDKAVCVILPVGEPTEIRSQKEKKPFSERAWFDRYGAASGGSRPL